MQVHTSVIKRHKQSVKRRLRNIEAKSSLRTLIKKTRQAIESKNLVFLTRSASGAYPQIVAIERDINQQIMTLHLERQRDVIQLPPAPKGNTPRFRSRTTGRDFV